MSNSIKEVRNNGDARMSWNDEFPSIIKEVKYASDCPKSWYVVPMLNVSENCLDRVRVREAIEKHRNDDMTAEYFARVLIEELGLVGEAKR